MNKMNAITIEQLLAEHWHLRAEEIVPVGPVWRAVTTEGVFCVKRGKHGLRRLLFDLHVIEALWEGGYQGTPRPRRTVSGELLADTPDGAFVVTAWVGRPLDFVMREERLLAAAELARFHASSANLQVPDEVRTVQFDGRWLRRFPERNRELAQFARACETPANAFEQEVTRELPTLLHLAHQAEDLLHRSSYEQMVRQIRTEPRLVHGNVKGENFTIDTAGQTAIIDYDSFRFDVWVQDLCDLFLSALPLCDWQPSEARAMFEAYHEVRPVSSAESEVLTALMSYPYEAYKVIHKYSTEPDRPLAKTLRKWQTAKSQMRLQSEFLQTWSPL